MRKLPFVIIAILVFGYVFANIKIGKSDSEISATETARAFREAEPKEASISAEVVDLSGSADYEPYVDTMFVIDGKALSYGDYDGGQKYGLLYDKKPLVYDPTTNFEALSSKTFAIDLVGRRKVFDAGRPSCIDEVKAFISPMKGFKRFEKDYVEHIDTILQETMYMFTLDYPDTTVAQREDIMKWLVELLEKSQSMDVCVPWYTSLYAGYTPSNHDDVKYGGQSFEVAKLGRFASDKYFATIREEYADNMPLGVYLTIDYRARILNDRFLTYRGYVHDREWLGHGMMTEYLHSYDLKNNKAIDFGYLFKPGTYDRVKQLLCEVIAADTAYTKNKNLEPTAEGVEKWIGWWNEDVRYDKDEDGLRLPQPGLTEKGVVFSFQPYEIDCFAAGSWHFTIPYAKAKPYMTKQAINMLGI